MAPDFAKESRGIRGNLTVEVDLEGKSKATITSRTPMHDLVVYVRVRVNTGLALGGWASMLEPWKITSDCDDERFLDNLGSKNIYPDQWRCSKCPEGAVCFGNILFRGAVGKFGYWRVVSKDMELPDTFKQCLFEASCLGHRNFNLAGRFYNVSEAKQLVSMDLTADNDWALMTNLPEYCNEAWGHAERCNNDTSRCRLCATCLPGYKRT